MNFRNKIWGGHSGETAVTAETDGDTKQGEGRLKWHKTQIAVVVATVVVFVAAAVDKKTGKNQPSKKVSEKSMTRFQFVLRKTNFLLQLERA